MGTNNEEERDETDDYTVTCNGNRADFVRDLSRSQKLWKVGGEYIITSAASVMMSGPETYVFRANEQGDITSFMELSGSYRGGLDHEKAILGFLRGD